MSSEPVKYLLYIISGGAGASGEQVVHTALAQFPEHQVRVITLGNVHFKEQIAEVVARIVQEGGLIVHTLVDAQLRRYLVELAQQHNLPAIDLMGPLLEQLASITAAEPLGHPGLYRRLHSDYYERIAAIEYTVDHDDSRRPHEWSQADLILTGVSRVGKTPLSLYLSVLGWKVANAPYIPDIPLPAELAKIDPRRVFAITAEPAQIILHRQKRQRRLGAPGHSTYTAPEEVFLEVQQALDTFRRRGFSVIDVTDKPIETSADEILKLATNRFGPHRRETLP
jgi:[pyruvate, water dikinase]-phosphate phosphotransferase / [pyruvate, water dikinase] kinase